MQRSIVLTSARSGSNFLLATMRRGVLQNSLVLGEIFKSAYYLDPLCDALSLDLAQISALKAAEKALFWREVTAAATLLGYSHLVAKLFYAHVNKDDQLLTDLQGGHKILHLIRLNMFDSFLSLTIAQKTGVWKSFSARAAENKDVGTVILSRKRLQDYVSRQREQIEHFRSFFSDTDYIEIYYEDIAGGPQHCASKLAEIYSLARVNPPKIGLEKQQLREKADIVANYSEVRDLDIACEELREW